MFKRKSLSPIVSTILLVVVAVILVTLILTWGKGFTNNKLPSSTSIFKDNSSSFLFLRSVHQLETENIIFLKNTHPKEVFRFIGYKLLTSTGYVFENQLLYFDEVKEFLPGDLKPLNLICFPEKTFTLELLTDKNTFVNLTIKVPDFNEKGYCFAKNGVLAVYNMKLIDNKLYNLINNSRTGTVNGNFIQTNNGLLFNGTDTYISFKSQISSESIQFRIKTTQNGEGTIFANAFKMYNNTSLRNIIFFDGKIQFGYDASNKIATTNLINNGSWHTITITKTEILDQDITDMYNVFIDAENSPLVKNLGPNRGSNYFLIGARYSGGYELFGNFEISNAIFYDKLLTEQEIKDYHSIMTNPLD